LLEPAPEPPYEVVLKAVQHILQVSAEQCQRAQLTAVLAASAQDGAGAESKSGLDQASAHPDLATVEARLHAAGVTRENIAELQPRWRWRLVNVAIVAGSRGPAGGPTNAQLQFMRAELDFRMMHMRHAAMMRHLSRLAGESCDMPQHDANSGGISSSATPARAETQQDPATPLEAGDVTAQAMKTEMLRIMQGVCA
jgi:hypothetical protein